MLIHAFITETLQEIRRGLPAGSVASPPANVELDFPVTIVLSRKQPGEHSLEVPNELPTPSSVARVRVTLTVDTVAKA